MRLLGPIFFAGLCILQAQILLFREFLVLSHGNELALGGMLMVWLVGTGLGSLAGGRIFGRGPGNVGWGLLPLGMAFLLLEAVAALRLLPSLLDYPWGESLSLSLWISLAFTSLLPFCFLSGLLFPFLVQAAKGASSSLQPIMIVYLVEAIGAAGGGVLGLFLITWVSGVPLALWIGLGLSVSSFCIVRCHPRRSPGDRRTYAALAGMVLFICLAIFLGKVLDQKSQAAQWRPYHLIKVRETPFGSLSLAERSGQLNFFMNGTFQFSSPEPRRAEEKSHLPLLIHPQPGEVFLLGGGLSGTIREILKHPTIKRVDYVELDPDWVKEVGFFLPDLTPLIFHHPKVHLLFGDGRPILKKSAKRYDLILLDLPGPETLQLNRYYSREFFQIVKDHLNPGGLLAFTMSGAVDMMGLAQSQTLRSLYQTLKAVFPEALILAGEEIHLLGFSEKIRQPVTPSLVLSRIRQRSLALNYVHPLMIEDILSPWRVGYFETILKKDQVLSLNRDLTPVGFFNQTLLKLAHHYPKLAAWFQKARVMPLGLSMGIPLSVFIAFLLCLYFLLSFRTGSSFLLAIGVTGFSGMTLELIILFLFQVFLGYLYLEIGLLIAFFMLGLAGGAFVLVRRKGRPVRALTISGIQGLMAVSFLLLAGLTTGMGGMPEGLLKIIFYSLMVFSGGLSGGLYCLYSQVYFLLDKKIGITAGNLYGVDLLGAALACVGIPFFCLPVWGMGWTLVFLFLVNGLTAMLILSPRHRPG